MNKLTTVLPNGQYKFQWNEFKDSAEYLGVTSASSILLIDMDGTIRNGKHRLHLLPTDEQRQDAKEIWHNENSAYNLFNNECGQDEAIWPMIDLVQQLCKGSDVVPIVLTSCTSSAITVSATLSQLRKWGVPFELLVMRSADNQNNSVDLKGGYIRGMIYSGIHPENITVLDDDKGICNMARDYGCLALQVEDYTRNFL